MTSKVLCRIYTACGALLVAFPLIGCSDAAQPPEPEYVDISVEAADKQLPQLRLRIPRGYVNDLVGWWQPHMPKTQPTLPKSSVLLLATWPDLKPKTAETRKEFSDPAGTAIQVLVSPRSDLKDANSFEQRMQWLYKFKKEQNAVTSEGDRVDLLVSYPGRFDLDVVGMPAATMNETYPDGVTVRTFDLVMVPRGEMSSPSVVINCAADHIPEPESVPRPSRTPMCSMYFPSPTLHAVVDVGFRRLHLSDWRHMQQRVKALLDSFIVQPSK